MTNAIAIQQASIPTLSAGSLDSYVSTVNQIPVLTKEDEYDLAVRLRDQGDLDAARALITHHLRFVARIAKGYGGYGLPIADLIQEGNIGLMKAVKKFDPEVGVRLVSFAVHWIRAEIHEFVLRNWRIVKVATTKAQRKLFFNLRSSKKRLGWLNHSEVESVAGDLGVRPEEVLEMESRLSGQDIGFDAPVSASGDTDEMISVPAAYLTSQSEDPSQALENTDWSTHQNHKLGNALAQLDDRARKIIESRWLGEQKRTLQDLANELGVSAERVRQLENNALKKLRGEFAQ